jgi:hypothetical protein
MDDQWRELFLYPDRASAEVVAGLLRSESIPVRVVADEPVPGLVRSCTLWVPAAALARARKICREPPLTEEEWSKYLEENPLEEDGSGGTP